MATRTQNSRTGSSSKSRSAGKSNGRPRSSNSEVDRYRRAAEDSLQQLDWAIGYLHGIRKTDISKSLAKNRSYIRRHLMGEADQPLPAQQTDET
jgi:hypothetical protein